MFHIHCEVPKGWLCIIWFSGGKTKEYRNATRVFTNGQNQVCVVHGHQDVGTRVDRFPRENVDVVTVRETWTGGLGAT